MIFRKIQNYKNIVITFSIIYQKCSEKNIKINLGEILTIKNVLDLTLWNEFICKNMNILIPQNLY